MKNTVILTHGWTGSSVFAGLLERAGAWLGEETMVKPDYDTFENAQLVRINNGLMERFAAGLNHEHDFSSAQISQIAERALGSDLTPQREFMSLCAQHGPWLWKDPRLTWTIRVWAEVMDLSSTRFVVLTREPVQAWITANLRRHIQSMAFTRAYNGGITQSNVQFLEERGLAYLPLSFEDLLVQPQASLEKLNQHLGSALQVTDLQAVCRLPLGRRSRGTADFIKAAAIYAKNYGERDGRARLKLSPAIDRGASTAQR
jgi:hypothetical protein